VVVKSIISVQPGATSGTGGVSYLLSLSNGEIATAYWLKDYPWNCSRAYGHTCKTQVTLAGLSIMDSVPIMPPVHPAGAI